jgi:hypothetical protein
MFSLLSQGKPIKQKESQNSFGPACLLVLKKWQMAEWVLVHLTAHLLSSPDLPNKILGVQLNLNFR